MIDTPFEPRAAAVEGHRALETLADAPRLNRWIYSKLASGVRGDVLEIGSGVGNLSQFIVQDAERTVLSDFDSEHLDRLRRRFAGNDQVEIMEYDLDRPPSPVLAKRRFDAIVAVNVIEHVRDHECLVAILAGLLKPGGALLVYVPACPFAYSAFDRAVGHYRRYTPQSLSALLRSARLIPSSPRYMNFFGLWGWFVSGRVLKRAPTSRRGIQLFEALLPVLALEDHIPLPIGLGLTARAVKPAGSAAPSTGCAT